MSKNPAKDFGPIADDYAFFEEQATEAREDARAYLQQIQGVIPTHGTVRMLDFGCGSGRFTARFLQQAAWPPDRLQLTLVEPVEFARRQAVARVAALTDAPVTELATLPAEMVDRFDVILANHVFYYVPDLAGHLAKLIGALSPAGIFTTAIAGRSNALIEFWIVGFELLEKEIPYHTAEYVEAALQQLDAEYVKQQVAYDLSFPDTEENRMRIIRFLLADHLPQMPRQPLLDLFDRHQRAGRIEIHTASEHFTIRSRSAR